MLLEALHIYTYIYINVTVCTKEILYIYIYRCYCVYHRNSIKNTSDFLNIYMSPNKAIHIRDDNHKTYFLHN